MKTPGLFVFQALVLLASVLTTPSLAAQPLERLGAIGDSLTDEYDDQSYGAYARNWVELLVDQRGVDLGPTAGEAGLPGGTWGEPRRTVFQENWARYGADTVSALSQGQHTGVADAAATRGVTHAVVFIGNNNFGPGLGNTNVYNAIYNEVWTSPQIEAHIDQSLAELEQLIEPLDQAGLRIVLVTAFDFGATPTVRLFFPNVAKRELVTAAIASFGEGVRALASRRGAIFVDAFAAGRAVFGTNAAPRSSLLVGNVPIQLGQFGFSSGTTVAFVGDGVHPHTVVQGVLANLVVTALDLHAGTCLTPFSEAELLSHNGLAYGGSDTLAAEIGPLSAFVESFDPGYALRFFGSGVEAPTLDRVTFALDEPARPADVGASDFTLELWIKALPGDNTSTEVCSSSGDTWIRGNIVVDRDVFGAGDHGDYGLAVMAGGVLGFGVDNGTTGMAICGTTPIDDGQWHHVAITRRFATGGGRPAGEMRLFVDGIEDAAPVDGVDGDISYRDARGTGFVWDPFLVLGAEKHDAGTEYPSFNGFLDEIRLSTTLRYVESFAPPAAPFETDAATAALWSFDGGAGTAICDRSGAAGGPTNGELRVGGDPAGPIYVRDTPFIKPLFADGFESADTTAWSAAVPLSE